MDSLEAVQDLYAKVEAYGWPGNEAMTCHWIILPVLEAIGYSKFEVLQQDVDAGGKKPDFALLPNSPVSWFLEAKSWGVALLDHHAIQAVNYASTVGKRWAVLTNGMEWRLFDCHLVAKPASERCVLATNWDQPEFGVFIDAISKSSIQQERTAAVLRMGKLPSILRSQLLDSKSSVFKALHQRIKADVMPDVNASELLQVVTSLLEIQPTAPEPDVQEIAVKSAPVEPETVPSIEVAALSNEPEQVKIPLKGKFDFRFCSKPSLELNGTVLAGDSFTKFAQNIILFCLENGYKMPETSPPGVHFTAQAELAKRKCTDQCCSVQATGRYGTKGTGQRPIIC